jgi:hypothetical protein
MDASYFNIENIDELKRMQKGKYLGWSKYLGRYCQQYFDAGLSLKFIKQQLKELYDMDVSVDTLRAIRNRAKQEMPKPIPLKADSVMPAIPKSTERKREEKAILNKQNCIKEQVASVRKLTIEEAAANMDRFYQQQDNPRFDIDDLIEQQQKRQ